jgi:hypothetical protein
VEIHQRHAEEAGWQNRFDLRSSMLGAVTVPSNMSVAFAVADNPHLLGRNQAALRQDHYLGDERADLVIRIDDLDHDG